MQLYQNGVVCNKVEGVVLQPVGQMKNENRTLLKKVFLDDIRHLLTKVQHDYLENAFPSKEFLVWGVNDKGRTNDRYRLIKKGFIVLFYRKRRYFLCSEVRCCFRNSEVAKELWAPSHNNKNYNNLYFCSIDSLEDINLSASEVNEVVVGEAKDSPLRGLTIYMGERAKALLELL